MRNSEDMELGKRIVNYSLEVKRKLPVANKVKRFLQAMSVNADGHQHRVIITRGIFMNWGCANKKVLKIFERL